MTTASCCTFERPFRPLGIRIFNALGRGMRKLGLRPRPLEESELLTAARRHTGLCDFGDESFRDPLRVLLSAYEKEADLNPFGRLLARWNVIAMLSNRLRVQHFLSTNPEVLHAPVRKPLLVLGLPRTGTTLLYNLLAQDPAARPLRMWEAMWPAPWPQDAGRSPDPRIRRARRLVSLLQRLAPDLATIHPVDAEGPEECSRLILNTFVTPYALMEHYVPSYRQWLFAAPEDRLEAAYRDYARQLQALQWQRPPAGHWVLKSPVHLFALEALLKVFPDMAIVQLHRDPHKVVPSLCSLFAVYQGMASDADRSQDLGRYVLAVCVESLRRGRQARSRAEPNRVLDLQYAELMADPVGSLCRIYDHFGYRFTDAFQQRAAGWHRDHPQHQHGTHRYDLAPFGLTREMIDEAFRPYCRGQDGPCGETASREAASPCPQP